MTKIPDSRPLASRMRPASPDEFAGQSHLLAAGSPLRSAIMEGELHSMILWGPPGTGKTTLAGLMAAAVDAEFVVLSAVLAGVREIRAVMEEAKSRRLQLGRRTVLFVDEIHRFNKAQQDAFLPFVEEGLITLIGATTENPSFELNNALLSRVRVYVLKSLSETDLEAVITRALLDTERGLGKRHVQLSAELRTLLARAADGDARQALNLLEIAADFAGMNGEITRDILTQVLQKSLRRFDKDGDAFYDQISALHKSVRGSSPDAALYWLCRMLDGGCDPLYIARRVIRMACEDIGNADPRALQLALNACETYERLGSPEGELAIAQAVIYLAVAAKSNAVYTAYLAAKADVESSASHEVPIHLRNAPTRLLKELGHGKDYRYAHDEPGAFAAGENYFPERFSPRTYYHPVPRGLEIQISEKLVRLRGLTENENK